MTLVIISFNLFDCEEFIYNNSEDVDKRKRKLLHHKLLTIFKLVFT